MSKFENKGITVTEGTKCINVKFTLQGHMETYQQYRKERNFTDVTIHCQHVNSEDLTIYSAHSMLLSASCLPFSTLLLRSFPDSSNTHTGNCDNVTDNYFMDSSCEKDEGNRVAFSVERCFHKCSLYENMNQNTFDNRDKENHSDSRSSKLQNLGCGFTWNFRNVTSENEDSSFSVVFKILKSQNNAVILVKGLDPIFLKYILSCAYSENFAIDRYDISLFLSLISKIELNNYRILSELLEPFINYCSCQNIECRESISNSVPSSSIEPRDGNAILNPASKIIQMHNTGEEPLEYMPLDLTKKKKINNRFENEKDPVITPTFAVVPTVRESCMFYLSNRNLTSNALVKNTTKVVYNTLFKSRLYPYSYVCNNKKESSSKNKIYPSRLIYWHDYADEAVLQNKDYNKTEIKRNSNTKEEDNLCSEGSLSDRVFLKETVYVCTEESSVLHMSNKRNIESLESTFKGYNAMNKKMKYSNALTYDGHFSMPLSLENQPYSFDVHKPSEFGVTTPIHAANNTDCTEKSDAFVPHHYFTSAKTEPNILINDSLKKLEKNSAIEIQRLNLNKDLIQNVCKETISTFLSKKKELKIEHVKSISNDEMKSEDVEADLKVGETFIAEVESTDVSKFDFEREVKKTVSKSGVIKSKHESVKVTLNKEEYFKEGNEQPYRCISCEFHSLVVEDVVSHIRDAHFAKNLRIAQCIDSRCPVQLLFCSKEWETHVHHHIVSFSFHCSTCSYSTKTNMGIMRHEMSHSKASRKRIQKPVKCGNKIQAKMLRTSEGVTNRKKLTQPTNATAKRDDAFGSKGKNNEEKGKRSKIVKGSEISLEDVLQSSVFVKLEENIYARRKLHSSKLTKYFMDFSHSFIKGRHFGKSSSLNVNKEKKSSGDGAGGKLTEESKLKKDKSVSGAKKSDVFSHSDKGNSRSENLQRIKTRMVKLPKKKRKVFTCSFCDVVVSTKESLAKHYQHFHRFIVPFDCPFKGCDVRMEHTDHLSSHLSTHSFAGSEDGPNSSGKSQLKYRNTNVNSSEGSNLFKSKTSVE